jgi:hypothetical protein
MGRVREMFRGMAIGRAVATADMATGQAETKMNPGRSTFQAFFTACSASSYGLNISYVWTGHESPPGLKNYHTRSRSPMIVILAYSRVHCVARYHDLGCLFRALRYDAATLVSTLSSTGTRVSMFGV